MLDVEALKLTDEERARVVFAHEGDGPGLYTLEESDALADAATAKAVWGVVDWLEETAEHSADGNGYALYVLQKALEAAGMPRPSEE